MRRSMTLALILLTLLATTAELRAATQLLFRTPPGGVTVARGQRIPLAAVDVSAFRRLRVVAVSRASAAVGTLLPATIRLYIGEGDALALFDALALRPDTTPGTGDPLGFSRLRSPLLTWGATRVYDHPVIRTLAIVADGDVFAASTLQQPVPIELFLYGETAGE